MYEGKFIFDGRTYNSNSSRAIMSVLKKERLYSTNSQLIINYYFMREFLHEIVKLDDDIIVGGGNSMIQYLTDNNKEAFRLPTDLDISYHNPKELMQIFQNVCEKSKNWPMQYSLFKDFAVTANDVMQMTFSGKLGILKSSFKVDVIKCSDNNLKKLTMGKVISNDEEFDAKTTPIEDYMSKKMRCIISKLGFFNFPFYRIKDFYDFYLMNKNVKFDENVVNEKFNALINGMLKTETMDLIGRIHKVQDNIDCMLTNTDDLWLKYKNKNKVDEKLDINEIIAFGKEKIRAIKI